MKESRWALWLAAGAEGGVLLFLLSILAGRATPLQAAPVAQPPFGPASGPALAPSAAPITCTLATTTTDALPGINSFATAAILADYEGLALASGNRGAEVPPEEDYFRLDNAIVGYTYEVEAIPDGLGNYNLGIIVYNASYTPVLTDTNTLDGNSAFVALQAKNTGPYFFKVFQVSNFCSGGTYSLFASAIPPATSTPTPPPGPAPTSIPGADEFEPNYDFAHAATIATDITYDRLNFIPWGGGAEDNDYYKIWVKPGLIYTCRTMDLGPGVDTNMIFYDKDHNPLGGNDDVELGDYSSRFSYFATYEGFLYVLVGHGGRLPLTDVQQSSYSLRCDMSIPGIPTVTPTPRPASTPEQPGATPPTSVSPLPTPTPGGMLAVRTLATPPPPSPTGTPALRFVPVDLLVYYDANNDRSPGAGEGVSGILVQAYEATTGEQIAEGFTDEVGHLQFTAAARGPVRIHIPYLGVEKLIGSEGASLYIRIAPQPLPTAVP